MADSLFPTPDDPGAPTEPRLRVSPLGELSSATQPLPIIQAATPVGAPAARRRFAAPLGVGITLIIVTSVILALLWRQHGASNPAPLGTTGSFVTASATSVLAPTATPAAPTATPFPAKSVIISFTRKAEIVNAPSQVVAATNGSGQIPAQVDMTQNDHVELDTQKLITSTMPTFMVNVSNPTDHYVKPYNPVDTTVLATDGVTKCSLDSNVFVFGIAPNTIGYYACYPVGISGTIPAATWDNTTEYPPLTISGTNPTLWYGWKAQVPTDCGGPVTGSEIGTLENGIGDQFFTQNGEGWDPNLLLVNDPNNVTCDPAAGTIYYKQLGASYTYNRYSGGKMYFVHYTLNDLYSYQIAQLQRSAPANFIVIANNVPNSQSFLNWWPSAYTNETITSVTLTCPAKGVAAYNWTSTLLNPLATKLTGMSVSGAITYLNGLDGIVSGSVKISGVPANGPMPGNADAIVFQIQTPNLAV